MTPENFLHKLWLENSLNELGDRLSELIELEDQPFWCSQLIEVLQLDESEYGNQLVSIAYNRSNWEDARLIFYDVRKALLVSTNREEKIRLLLLELVAKVIFNASSPWKGNFDSDSFAWLPGLVRNYLDSISDMIVEESAIQHICFF